jgi:hypothetical protein
LQQFGLLCGRKAIAGGHIDIRFAKAAETNVRPDKTN